MSNQRRPKQVTRILVKRDENDNDVAITYYVQKFATSYDAVEFFGADYVKAILQRKHETDERRNALRNSELATKAVTAIAASFES